jgi:hypothetical protein
VRSLRNALVVVLAFVTFAGGFAILVWYAPPPRDHCDTTHAGYWYTRWWTIATDPAAPGAPAGTPATARSTLEIWFSPQQQCGSARLGAPDITGDPAATLFPARAREEQTWGFFWGREHPVRHQQLSGRPEDVDAALAHGAELTDEPLGLWFSQAARVGVALLSWDDLSPGQADILWAALALEASQPLQPDAMDQDGRPGERLTFRSSLHSIAQVIYVPGHGVQSITGSDATGSTFYQRLDRSGHVPDAMTRLAGAAG